MKIAVCLKSVPDTTTKIQIAPDNMQIITDGVHFITSPYDEFALEEALRLRDKFGGEVCAFSLGDSHAVDVLRDSLARGADNAVHINDPDLYNLDPLNTAKVLAAAIKGQGFDVIFCGQQGVGGDNSAVPSMLAELLDVSQVTLVVKLELNPPQFKAEREIEGAHEIVEGSLPALFSAQKGLNEPRYPSIKGVMAARKKEIAVQDAASLGLSGSVGSAQVKMHLTQLSPPPVRPSGKMIEGDAAQQAKTLAELLRTEAKVI